MKLEANLEIINNVVNQGGYKKSPPTFCQLAFVKDSGSNKYLLIVNSTKKPTADKYRLANNIEKIHARFLNEGKATVVLKEPNFNLAIQKADAKKLRIFLKLIELANNSQNIGEALNKLGNDNNNNTSGSQNATETVTEKVKTVFSEQQKQTQFKKPVTSLTVKSLSEYRSNFKAIISQNLKIKTSIGDPGTPLLNLTKLIINNCDLKYIDKSLFGLEQLTLFDFSNNKLAELDDFEMRSLKELILANNQIKRIGENVKLPNICVLDASFNQLTDLSKSFCVSFQNLSKLRLNNNKVKNIYDGFGYFLTGLKSFYANANDLKNLPFSFCLLALEMLELNENPFEFAQVELKLNKPFPTLVELCSRFVADKKIRHTPRDLPRTLCDYIDTYFKCGKCGKTCFEYHLKNFTTVELNSISIAYTYVNINGQSSKHVPVKMYVCSLKCRSKISKVQYVF